MRSLPVFLLIVALVADVTQAYYCDHNLCHATDEYCCGDNLCCDYANSSSYFWLSILIVLLVLAAGWALISLFCMPVLHQKQDAVKLMCGSLLNRTRGPRKISAWTEDPESSPLSHKERAILKKGESGAKESGTSDDVYYHCHGQEEKLFLSKK